MTDRGSAGKILDLVGELRVEDVIATFDVAFDIPLRHWQAMGLLQLAQATLPVDAGDTTGLAARVGAFWCDIVRADVELDLRRGLTAVDDSRADAERLVAVTEGGFSAYVAARSGAARTCRATGCAPGSRRLVKLRRTFSDREPVRSSRS